MQRILELFGVPGKTPELPCLVRIVKDNVRMNVLEYPLPCGHEGYRVDLAFYAEELDRWVEIAALRDFNLEPSIHLLQQAQKCIRNWHE